MSDKRTGFLANRQIFPVCCTDVRLSGLHYPLPLHKKIMAAYVIAEVAVHNPLEMEEYRKQTPASIAAFDGKFIARGGQTISLEGDWNPERIVILKFPSLERAREWYNSELYLQAKVIRQRAGYTRMIMVDGV